MLGRKKSGDPCDGCKAGRLRTVTSRPAGPEFQLRYLACPKCGTRCRCLVRADEVRRRAGGA